MNQQEYLIEKLAQENARLTVELHKVNFAVIALQEQLEFKNNEIEELKTKEETEE